MPNDRSSTQWNLARPALALAVLALPAVLAACAQSPAAANPAAKASEADATPISVKLVPVRDLKTPRVVTLSGSLIGAEEAQVAAGAAGKVVATYVERGTYVRKGAVLAKLD